MYSFNIIDWQANAPGLGSQQACVDWALAGNAIDPTLALSKATQLPMMAARRLTEGSLAAVDSAMLLLAKHEVDAVIFASRHGELERNFRILSDLAKQAAPSPTDFTMSVHNAAVGSFTIATKKPLVASSVAAGEDTFQQALFEAQSFFAAGYNRVLLVDFDGAVPDFYRPYLAANEPCYPWALALLLEVGKEVSCSGQELHGAALELPQALQFLRGWLSGQPTFSVSSTSRTWKWNRT